MNTFHIKTASGIEKKDTLAETLGADPDKDNLMFISAHDDDSPIGAGMVIAKAVEEGFNIYAVIATNGIMGYCSAEQQNSIVEIRAKET
ncbi:MAG: PIG-L deacetylase family protein, partial [Planctomycetota bacterium]